VASLFATRALKVCNQKNKLKSVFFFDEYPTLAVDTIPAISTGRSNLMSVVLGIQSVEQLKDNYGAEKAAVITSIGGNLICGQQTGDAAKKLSETFGKIMQERESKSINASDISITKSKQLEYAIPASRIASLSSGEFVGFVADNPDQRIPQKIFHCELQNDHEVLAKRSFIANCKMIMRRWPKKPLLSRIYPLFARFPLKISRKIIYGSKQISATLSPTNCPKLRRSQMMRKMKEMKNGQQRSRCKVKCASFYF
jgi:hypothetical protein